MVTWGMGRLRLRGKRNPDGKKRDRGIDEARPREANLGVKPPSCPSQPIEGYREFEEIQADHGQRSDAREIRQTVPTTCSSTG